MKIKQVLNCSILASAVTISGAALAQDTTNFYGKIINQTPYNLIVSYNPLLDKCFLTDGDNKKPQNLYPQGGIGSSYNFHLNLDTSCISNLLQASEFPVYLNYSGTDNNGKPISVQLEFSPANPTACWAQSPVMNTGLSGSTAVIQKPDPCTVTFTISQK